MAFRYIILAIGFAALSTQVTAEHLTAGGHQSAKTSGFLGADSRRFREKVTEVITSMLDAGHDQSFYKTVKTEVASMWTSLPKNAEGRIDRRSLSYAVHRYFMSRHHISIIGLEPQANDENARIFVDFAPHKVHALLNEGSEEKGYTLNDVAAMITMLQTLLAGDSTGQLEALYTKVNRTIHGSVSLPQAEKLVEHFLFAWLHSDSDESLRLYENNLQQFARRFPNFHEFSDFAKGLVSSFEHRRWLQSTSSASMSGSWRPLNRQFSFSDVEDVVGEMRMSFGNYWLTQCADTKESLLKLDYASNGRVKLSDFHKAKLEGEWRFAESADYLRKLGALDESHGSHVIVANYLQGANNCIINGEYFRVCCPMDCDQYMAEIESVVQSPVASPELLLSVVGNMTSTASEALAVITPQLKSQLYGIATTHRGSVPVHGRLFAQWLHYVFPQECPFPHKKGNVELLAPTREQLAERAELVENSKVIETEPSDAPKAIDWMSQWSEEEELLSSTLELSAPWEARSPVASAVAFFGLLLLVIYSVFNIHASSSAVVTKTCGGIFGEASTKAHLV